MKVLAIDYGTKKIGLALSDDEQGFAFPYNTLNVKCSRYTSGSNVKCLKKVISDIKNICKLENVERIVVGMPLDLSGEKNELSEEVFEFVKKLEEFTGLPVETEDERLTTKAALKLKNKTTRNLNELSAQILLQGWLDKSRDF